MYTWLRFGRFWFRFGCFRLGCFWFWATYTVPYTPIAYLIYRGIAHGAQPRRKIEVKSKVRIELYEFRQECQPSGQVGDPPREPRHRLRAPLPPARALLEPKMVTNP